MSANSLKRSLELLEGNKPIRKAGKSARTTANPFMPKPIPAKVTLSSIIKSKKKAKQTVSKPPTTQSSRPKNAAMAKNRIKPIRSQVEENVRKLLMFSSTANLDNESTQKLIKRAQTQKYVISEPKPKEEQATVFTDEDFRKFEREYFCS